MAIYKTKGLLLTIDKNQLAPLLNCVVKESLPVEFLNPNELGQQWQGVEYLQPDTDSHRKDLATLDALFKFYPTGDFWSNFEENKTTFSRKELEIALKGRADAIEYAEKLLTSKNLEKSIARLSKGKKNALKNASKIEELTAKNHTLRTELMVDRDVDVASDIIPEMKKVYTAIELDKKSREISKFVFKTDKNTENLFCFIAFALPAESRIMELLTEQKISSKSIDWNKDVVIWEDKGLESFKQISSALGTAQKDEVDPTIFVSFFFAFFFALALNDALYGLLIAAFAGYLLFFRNVKKSLKNTFGLLFVSGIFSLIIGAFTGSWAGNLFEKILGKDSALHGFIGEGPIHFFESIQLIKQIPTNEAGEHLPVVNNFLNANAGGASPIVALLGFAIVIGLVHIFTALTIKGVNAIKQNHINHAITEFAWIAFLISSMSYFLVSADFKVINIAISVATLGAVFVFNSGKTILQKIMKGLIQLYELVAFLADILSYTRLIAIGLTGAIIADVINLLAFLVLGEKPNIISGFFFVVVLLIGHIFNLVVGLFSAYINPLRLHYVEFLPKFYKGKSRALKSIDSDLKFAEVRN
jgi:hypothetical protein